MTKNIAMVFTLLLLPIGVYLALSGGSSIGLFSADTTQSSVDVTPVLLANHQVNGNIVTIIAVARDDSSVKTIKLYVDGSEVKSCSVDAANADCVYVGNFAGTHSYKALATDGQHFIASGDKSFIV